MNVFYKIRNFFLQCMEKENVDNWKRKPNIITVYTLRNVTWTWYWILYISSLILPEFDIEYCIYQGIHYLNLILNIVYIKEYITWTLHWILYISRIITWTWHWISYISRGWWWMRTTLTRVLYHPTRRGESTT